MAFTGKEGERISLEEGAALTANYRNAAGSGATLSHYFGVDIIAQILAQPLCVGIRVYYGQDEGGKKQLVLVGVDAQENDMTDGILGDKSLLCPPYCPNPNPLSGL